MKRNKNKNMKLKGLCISLLMLGVTVAVVFSGSSVSGIGDTLVATRSINPDTVAPGETFTVTVLLQANGDVTAPSLDENVPAGWTVTPVDNDGFTFKPSTLEWVLVGAWSAGNSATIIYDVTVPGGATEMTYSLSGTTSGYGVGPFAVGGETDVTVSGGAVNMPPVADPDGPYTANVGETINFDGSGSYDTDGTIVSYSWEFGDSGTGSGVGPAHAYASSGTFIVNLTVQDNEGATDTESTTAIIGAVDLLVATRSINPDTVAPGETFTVTVLLQANGDVTAPSLDENVPAGWTVTPVDNDGFTFKPSTLEWVLVGAWSAGNSATIIYDVTVPGGATEMTYSLSGTTSGYGVGPFAVGGETDVTVSGGVLPLLVATRSINPDTVAPGETFTVTVLLQANGDVTAPSLDENVPAGWTVTPVDNDGFTFKPSTLEWVLVGAWSAGNSATIIYDVTVPGGATEMTYSLSGTTSGYGVGPFAVGGETCITVSLLVGDLNDDGDINVLDMIMVGNHWGETGTPGWIPEDLNNDGVINEGDMVVIGQNWTG